MIPIDRYQARQGDMSTGFRGGHVHVIWICNTDKSSKNICPFFFSFPAKVQMKKPFLTCLDFWRRWLLRYPYYLSIRSKKGREAAGRPLRGRIYSYKTWSMKTMFNNLYLLPRQILKTKFDLIKNKTRTVIMSVFRQFLHHKPCDKASMMGLYL